jgi:hypothetical protein
MPPEGTAPPPLAEHLAPWIHLQPEDTARRMLQTVIHDLQRRGYTDKDIVELVHLYLFVASAG